MTTQKIVRDFNHKNRKKLIAKMLIAKEKDLLLALLVKMDRMDRQLGNLCQESNVAIEELSEQESEMIEKFRSHR